MMNQAKTLLPIGAVAFTGAAIAAAATDGRSLPVRILAGFVLCTAFVGVAAHFGIVKLGAAGKAVS
jgi:hypothetical protein